MSDEYNNYGGLRLKDDNGGKEKPSEPTKRTPINYNAFDGTNLNLDNNSFFQEADKSLNNNNPYNINMEDNGIRYKVSLPNWPFILCAFVAMIFLFIQIGVMRDMAITKRLMKEGHYVTGEVTDVVHHYRSRSADTYTIYVDYEVEGKVYSHILLGNSYSSRYEGETMKIYYDKHNPKKITSEFTKSNNTARFIVMWILFAAAVVAAVQAYRDPDGFTKAWGLSLVKRRGRWRW